MGLRRRKGPPTPELKLRELYVYDDTTVRVTHLEEGGETALVKVVESGGSEVVGATLRVHIPRFTEVWTKQ